MPLFSSNKFLPKKTPQRKIGYNFPKRKSGEDEFKFEIDTIKLNVGDQNAVFLDGEWIPEGGVSGQRVKDNQRLKQHLQQLETENNFLKLKNEVLLDMEQKQNEPKHTALKGVGDPLPSESVKQAGAAVSVIKSRARRRRGVFEETFPELIANQMARERSDKIRYVCRTEADIEEVMNMLRAQERKIANAAEIPPLRERPQKWEGEFEEKLDEKEAFGKPVSEEISSFSNEQFIETFQEYPKDFPKIAEEMNRSASDCISYYYLTKHNLNRDHYKRWKAIRKGLHKRNDCRTKYLNTGNDSKPKQ